MTRTTMKRLTALLLALLLALSTLALAEEAVEAPAEPSEVIENAEPANPDEPAEEPAAEEPAGEDAADEDGEDEGEIVEAVAGEDECVSAEAVDAVFEELEEELVDEEIAETELDLGGEEETASEEPYFGNEEEPPLRIGEFGFPIGSPFTWSKDNRIVQGNTFPTEWNGSVSFDPNGNVLTLNGFTGEGNNIWYSDVALTINLVGTNKIINTKNYFGIVTSSRSKSLCITGSGTLEINAGDSNNYGLGIICYGSGLTIIGSPTINITANAPTNAYGIVCKGKFEQSGGTVTVTAGESRNESIGILSEDMNITGGTLTAQSKGTNKDKGGFAAGVDLSINNEAWGELTLGDNMILTYGENASGAKEHTAAEFNAIKEVTKLPPYFHVEEKAADPDNPSDPETPAAPAARPAPSIDAGTLFFATAVSEGKNGLKFTWTQENNVDGYDVFLKRCTANKAPFEVVGSSKGTTCTVTGLKKNKCYKGYVQAYVMEGRVKKYVLEPTTRFHVYTNNGRKGLSNPESVSVRYSKAEKKAGLDEAKVKNVTVGKTIKIKAKVKGAKSGKVIKHVGKLRLLSTNPAVAKVVWKKAKKGKKGYVGIKGLSRGSCRVYVLTNNGVYDTFTVNVQAASK